MQEGAVLYQQAGLVLAGVILAILVYYAVLKPRIYKRVERAVRDRKDQFTGLASHYLLTPITIIQTAVSRLQEADTTLNVDQRKMLYEAIILGQQRLWIIAEQLVLINQIDFNELTLQIAAADIIDTVSGAIAAVDIFARHKKVTIQMEDNTQEIRQARFDPRRMKQAVIAVLDNAIKFSMEGSVVKVRVGLVEGLFLIEVEDTGVGIPPETLAHLGEKFYRGSGIYNFDYEGLGLGLHIANAILREHQGDVRFQSKPKNGTLVTIEFPNI